MKNKLEGIGEFVSKFLDEKERVGRNWWVNVSFVMRKRKNKER